MSTMYLSGVRPHPTPCKAMDTAHILAVLAQGTQIETRIREDRAVLVPFALLQGATPLEVAEALGRWTRNELSGAIVRWAWTLRRAGRIAPAERDHLLGLNTDDVPERW